eukprot:484316_1
MNDNDNIVNCGGVLCVVCGMKKETENNNERNCNVCTLINISQSHSCEMCGSQKEKKARISDQSFEPNISNNTCSYEDCGALNHLMTALKYYESIRDTKYQLFDEYCDEKYPNILNDYIHFILCHSNQIEEINKSILHNNGCGHCNITECAVFNRYYNDNGRRMMDKSDSLSNDEIFPFYSDLFDRFHYFIYHLFDVGIRIKADEMNEIENKQAEHNLIDYKFVQKQKLINDKRDQYKINRFNDNNNKYTLNIQNNNNNINVYGQTMFDSLLKE